LHREHWRLDLLGQRKTPDALMQKGFFIVAPRPGLEPGTYGLTENSLFKIFLFYAVCKP
jgi:hypothetical protein